MARKPKPGAWRGVYCLRHGEWAVRKDDGFASNCTVIPDGATAPLPASVRRVLIALHRQQRRPHKARSLPHALWLEIGRILAKRKAVRK